jgi:hypothetical protein
MDKKKPLTQEKGLRFSCPHFIPQDWFSPRMLLAETRLLSGRVPFRLNYSSPCIFTEDHQWCVSLGFSSYQTILPLFCLRLISAFYPPPLIILTLPRRCRVNMEFLNLNLKWDPFNCFWKFPHPRARDFTPQSGTAPFRYVLVLKI